MRILDEETNRSRDRITLYLERSEAEQLLAYLTDLLEDGQHHAHLSSSDDRKEVTICLYDKNDRKSLDQLNERSKLLIETDQ